jgi:SAM-dependent methyltransferase
LKTHFELPAAEYERSRQGHLGRRRRELVAEELMKRDYGRGTVLEVGCGTGGLLAGLAADHHAVSFLGVDVEPKMVEHARERHEGGNVRYLLADLSTEPPSVTCDFAYSVDVLHHVRDLPRFLAGLHAMLVPGATWLAIEPNIFHPYIFWSQGRMRRAGLDEDHFRPWAVEPTLRETGFEVADRRFAFLFPGWLETVPAALAWLEAPLERFRFLGGSVVYRLRRL